MAVVVFTSALVAFGVTTEAAIKCWTNKEGVRECGNTVPPEYAKQGHEELNKAGITVDHTTRAKTAEELAADEEAAAKAATEAAAERERAAKDRVLLDTFSSVDDMIFARDGRITSIGSQIKLAESQIEKLDKNLQEIISAAAEIERQGQKPSEKTESDIANVRQQIDRKRAFIEAKRLEQESVRKQFDTDIARFQELKGETAPASTNATSAEGDATASQ
jgi:hypothetical protein